MALRRALAPLALALAACTAAVHPLPELPPSPREAAPPADEPPDPAPEVSTAPPLALPPAPPPTKVSPPVRAIAVGEHLSCALLEGGEVRCWGATRLAAVPLATRPTPVVADGVSLSVGRGHVCVARVDGSLVCWGDNRDGQLGDGSLTDATAPTPVAGLTGIVEVAAGGSQTCARDSGGAVFCWGHSGCVGHPREKAARRPGRVTMPAATRLVAGDDITCAFLAEGTPRCWGFNTTGLLSPSLGPVLRAFASPPLERATTLALGYRHVCITQDDDQVWCAGSDHHGQLGDQDVPDDAHCDQYSPKGVVCQWTERPPPEPEYGPDEPRPPPPPYPPPTRPLKNETRTYPNKQWFVLARDVHATALAAGHGRSCAITPERSVKCWGQWSYGSDWAHRRPRVIEGADDAVAIAVAQEHACALLADRSVRCWGYNRSGELGNGEYTEHMVLSPKATPVRW